MCKKADIFAPLARSIAQLRERGARSITIVGNNPTNFYEVLDGTWWAGDWMSVDGVDVGSESWTDRRGRCQVRVPHVLSRMSQDVTAWVTAHEIGHCLGLSDTGGTTGVMGDSLGYAVSAAEAEAIWESA